ncbi:MAG TPA: hypothetical protein VEC35_13630 [Noviherbaspirillum sp.]|nr:hypothetical protein [Noviherbaspirillum sp.]
MKEHAPAMHAIDARYGGAIVNTELQGAALTEVRPTENITFA